MVTPICFDCDMAIYQFDILQFLICGNTKDGIVQTKILSEVK